MPLLFGLFTSLPQWLSALPKLEKGRRCKAAGWHFPCRPEAVLSFFRGQKDQLKQISVAPMSRNSRGELHLSLQAALFIMGQKMGLAGGVIFIDEERGIGLVFRAIEINSAQVSYGVNASHGYTSMPEKPLHYVRITSRADHTALFQ